MWRPLTCDTGWRFITKEWPRTVTYTISGSRYFRIRLDNFDKRRELAVLHVYGLNRRYCYKLEKLETFLRKHCSTIIPVNSLEHLIVLSKSQFILSNSAKPLIISN